MHAMGDWNAAFAHQNCTKKTNKLPRFGSTFGPGFWFPFWAPNVFFSILTPQKPAPKTGTRKSAKKRPLAPAIFGRFTAASSWQHRESNMPLTWHLPWASLTYYATTCSWHSPLPAYAASSAWTASLSGSKNGARNWRREASSNSCLLCSSFHLESRLAEFKHTSAIISGDYHLQIPVQYNPWWAQKPTHKRKSHQTL